MDLKTFTLFAAVIASASCLSLKNDTTATTELKCISCVNQTFTFYKTIVNGFDVPHYMCNSSSFLVSKYALIVGIYCTPDDCDGITDHEIIRVFNRDESICPGTNRFISNQPIQQKACKGIDRLWKYLFDFLFYTGLLTVFLVASRLETSVSFSFNPTAPIHLKNFRRTSINIPNNVC